MKKAFRAALAALLILGFSACGAQVAPESGELYEDAIKDGSITVVVDPGHGLGDVGALNEENLGNITEAMINFAVAENLCTALTERGYTVILTHDGITKPDTAYDDGKGTYGPSERSDFSNSTDADLFISIHADSFPTDPNVYGTRVYYPVDTPNSTARDKALAAAIGSAIDTAGLSDKAVLLRDMHGEDCYTVLYKTVVPSVLIEVGFITNPGDAKKLADAEFRSAFAAAVADGVDAYFGIER